MNILSQQQINDDDDDDDFDLNNNVASCGGRGSRSGYQITTKEDLLGDSSGEDKNLNNNATSPRVGRRNARDSNNNDNDDDDDDIQQHQQPYDLGTNWIRRINKNEADADYFILRLDDGSIDKKNCSKYC